ncbi:AAA family ATPase [Beduini massiliensis]|uniref:AAA family ATPase n=1 Tax=Beduini massiliensis TaxID=1585974 RepID=UPI00059AAD82|nr:AAA family ATPase [Beduini massiliensis]
MDKKFDDLLNSVFGTKKTLEKMEKEHKKSGDLVSELEQMSKQMDQLIKENSRQMMKNTSKQMDKLQQNLKEEMKEETPKEIDFGDFETKLKDIMIGQDRFIHQLVIAFKRAKIAGNRIGKIKNNILVLGKQGTGKQLVLDKSNELLYLLGEVKSKNLHIMDLSLYPSQGEEKLFLQDLFALLSKSDSILVFLNFEQCFTGYLSMITQLLKTGKITLNKRYILNNHQLVESTNVLSSDSIGSLEANQQYLIFVSDQSISQLTAKLGTKFIQLFGDICETNAFSEEEVAEITKQQQFIFIQRCLNQLQIDVTVDPKLETTILKKYDPQQGIESIQYQYDKLYQGLVELKLQETRPIKSVTIQQDMSVLVDEIVYPLDHLLPNQSNLELQQVIDELDTIIGLKEIKEYILSLKDHYEIMKLREQSGFKTSDISKHMIFTGNPGTGKTTIARIVSRYLKAIGILESGQLVEVSRGDLVGRYVGHTAPLTKQVVESALGGVLFIDEAYSLYRGKEDSFGLEAIDTLVKCMEDYRDQLIVILAGYTKEMSEFLEANSGLKSRFPNIIEFPDYTAQELLDITFNIAASKDYQIDEECFQPLLHYFEQKQKTDSQRSGNGRMARNLIEQAMINQAKRLIVEKEASINQLKLSDFDFVK